ncbi:MAG: SLC13/DASS family transporter, partial [Acidimicrobiales bacterium]|nr:SLC13/DASS family transporter [Acidimicrobiales bacterium]
MESETAIVDTTSRRVWAIPLALIIGLILASTAPSDWSEGSGLLEVRYLDELVMSHALDIGSSELVNAYSDSGDVEFDVSIPTGVPTEGEIDIELTVTDPTRSLALGDVEIEIVTSAGSRELVPVFGLEDRTFDASRRAVAGSAVVLAVLGAAMVLWVTEAVPLFVTSLAIPVALAVAGVGTAADTLSPFFDPIIVLFFGGFLMAAAMRRADLDHLVSVTVVDVAGGGPMRLYAAMLALSAFLSMWMSNTAAVTVLIPIALAVTEPLDAPRYRKVVVLGIAYAATIGGVGSAIGTPANPLAITFLENYTGNEISFAGWFAFGLPMVVLFLPFMALYLWFVSGASTPEDRFHHAKAAAREQRHSAGPLSVSQIQVVSTFLVVMGLWLTQTWHGVNTGIVALGGAVALFVLGRLEPVDLSRISWPTLLTFGGGLTLGTFMVTTGTSDWLVSRLGGVAGWPDLLALLAVAFMALLLTTVASNTAAAATLIPLAIPLAGILDVDPVLLVVIVAIATSIDFALVIGT